MEGILKSAHWLRLKQKKNKNETNLNRQKDNVLE